mmetsp:Transcript_3697/g.9404  ORF Transcript_3697/g.9404 Transcript_3697/m.9404 type:complete len:231 (-) Transcript_3697:51-743(-)
MVRILKDAETFAQFAGTWGVHSSALTLHDLGSDGVLRRASTSFSGSKVPLGSGDWIGMQALDTQPRRGPVFPLVIPIKPPPGKLPAPGEKDVGDTRMELYSSNLESGQNLDVFGMKKPMLANETALVQSSRAQPYGGGGGAEAMHNLMGMAPSSSSAMLAPAGQACPWDQVVDDKAEVAMWETLEHAVTNRLRTSQPSSLLQVVEASGLPLLALPPGCRPQWNTCCHAFL